MSETLIPINLYDLTEEEFDFARKYFYRQLTTESTITKFDAVGSVRAHMASRDSYMISDRVAALNQGKIKVSEVVYNSLKRAYVEKGWMRADQEIDENLNVGNSIADAVKIRPNI